MSDSHQAWQMYREGKLAQAEQILLASLTEQQSCLNALMLLGDIKMDRGKYSEAQALLQQCFDVMANAPAAERDTLSRLANNMAFCLEKTGQHEQAEAWYGRALAFDPANIKAAENLATFAEDRETGPESVSLLAESLKSNPGNLTVLRGLICAEARNDRWSEMFEHLQRLRKAAPDSLFVKKWFDALDRYFSG